MKQQNKTIKNLLLAVVQQISEMGEFTVDCNGEEQQELLWFMFRFKSKAPINLEQGQYIYQYETENDGPIIDTYAARLTTVENDVIYLYKID